MQRNVRVILQKTIVLFQLAWLGSCHGETSNKVPEHSVSPEVSEEQSYYYSDGSVQRLNKLDSQGGVIFSEWFSPEGALIWKSNEWEYNQSISSTGLTIYLDDNGCLRAIIQSKDGFANGIGLFFQQPAVPSKVIEYVDGEVVNERLLP